MLPSTLDTGVIQGTGVGHEVYGALKVFDILRLLSFNIGIHLEHLKRTEARVKRLINKYSKQPGSHVPAAELVAEGINIVVFFSRWRVQDQKKDEWMKPETSLESTQGF